MLCEKFSIIIMVDVMMIIIIIDIVYVIEMSKKKRLVIIIVVVAWLLAWIFPFFGGHQQFSSSSTHTHTPKHVCHSKHWLHRHDNHHHHDSNDGNDDDDEDCPIRCHWYPSIINILKIPNIQHKHIFLIAAAARCSYFFCSSSSS